MGDEEGAFVRASGRRARAIHYHIIGLDDNTACYVLTEMQSPVKPTERLAIKSDGLITILKTADIAWIEAAHNYVEIHEDKRSHLLRETMGGIEHKLSPEEFVRISRSAIVNIDRVKELQPIFHGEYKVTLHNGKSLTLSRRYRSKLPRLGVA